MRNTFRLLLLAAGLALPFAALADYSLINGTVESVGSGLPFLFPTGVCSGNAACGFVEIAEGVIVRFRPLLTIAGAFVMVIFGYRMIVGQEDDVITKARGVMSGTIAGLIMAWLIDPFIQAFYGSAGEVPQGAMAGGAGVLSAEVNGIINWVLVIVATLSVMMLILTALKAVGQSASGEGITHLRQTIFTVGIGIILIVFRFVLSDGFVSTTGNPVPILAEAMTAVSYIMGFLGLVALIIVVYAGFQYVLSMGKEESATAAKGLLMRAAIGAIVILLSLALVNFVIIPGVQ